MRASVPRGIGALFRFRWTVYFYPPKDHITNKVSMTFKTRACFVCIFVQGTSVRRVRVRAHKRVPLAPCLALVLSPTSFGLVLPVRPSEEHCSRKPLLRVASLCRNISRYGDWYWYWYWRWCRFYWETRWLPCGALVRSAVSHHPIFVAWETPGAFSCNMGGGVVSQ